MSFQWIDCHFFLKKSIGSTEVTLNLNPLYKLQYLDSTSIVKDISYDVKISFQKPLMFDRQIGWNWHKSWNIPDITVELKADPFEGLEVAKSMKSLKAEIYIVKPVFSKEYSMYIQDLELEGSTCYNLKNNEAKFSSLRFSATSYNSEGSKFHFLIVIYQQSQQSDQEWKVLVSKISTPVFVDSRKSAREVELIKLKKLSSFIEPFDLPSLEKNFIKKECKKQREVVEQFINNDIEGLFNYFGAANIRNKIKHPLFLGFKFSSCLEIYINTKQTQSKQPQQTIYFLQKCLEQSYKQQELIPPLAKLENKKLIFFVRWRSQGPKPIIVKKVVEFLQTIENDSIEIINDENKIPSYYSKLEINQKLFKEYKEIRYKLLLNHLTSYKNRQNTLKKLFEPIGDEPTSISEAKADNDNKLPIPSPEQDQVNDSDSQSSSSSSGPRDQSLNIPLKCQINIDPIKKKPFSMSQIIKLHNNFKVNNFVKCDQSKTITSKQLSVLNSLMRREIEEIKQRMVRENRMRNSVYQNVVISPENSYYVPSVMMGNGVKQEESQIMNYSYSRYI